MRWIIGIIVAVLVGWWSVKTTIEVARPSSIDLHTAWPSLSEGESFFSPILVAIPSKTSWEVERKFAIPIEYHVHNEGSKDVEDVFLEILHHPFLFDERLLRLYDFGKMRSRQSSPINFDRSIDSENLEVVISARNIRPKTSIIYDHAINIPVGLTYSEDSFDVALAPLYAAVSGRDIEKQYLKIAIGAAHVLTEDDVVDVETQQAIARALYFGWLEPSARAERGQHTFLGYFQKLVFDNSKLFGFVMAPKRGDQVVGGHVLLEKSCVVISDANKSSHSCATVAVQIKRYQWKWLFK